MAQFTHFSKFDWHDLVSWGKAQRPQVGAFPNGDRRSFKANLRPIADVAPPHLRRFTTDLRPECNIYRRYSTVGSAPIGGESAVTFALNRPRFGLGRTSSGHKKMRTAHDWCRRLALIHQCVRFTCISQKPPFCTPTFKCFAETI